MKRAIVVFAVLAVLWLGALYTNGKDGGSLDTGTQQEAPQPGFQAPRFALEGLDGKSYSLESLKGKPVVINFWASWCDPCKEEAPELVKLYEEYKGRVEILAVNATAYDSEEKAEAFAKAHGFSFPVLLDRDGAVADAYQVKGFPTTFFVNGDGAIESVVQGYAGPERGPQLLREKVAAIAGN